MANINLTTVLNSALNVLGILDSIAGALAQQLADGLFAANNLILSKSVDRLMGGWVTRSLFPVAAGIQFYQLGTGMTWDYPAPAEIVSASLLLTGLTLPIKIVNATEWGQIPDREKRSLQVSKLFYARKGSGGNSGGIVWLSPIPLAAANIELITWNAIKTFPDQTTLIWIADEYVRWLILALAVELAPAYPSAQTPPTLLQDLADASATLRNLNASLYGIAPAAGQIAPNAQPPAAVQPIASEGG